MTPEEITPMEAKIERLLHAFDRLVTYALIDTEKFDAIETRLTALTSVATELEEHLYVCSVALLHTAMGVGEMHETLMSAEALRLAYRTEGGHG